MFRHVFKPLKFLTPLLSQNFQRSLARNRYKLTDLNKPSLILDHKTLLRTSSVVISNNQNHTVPPNSTTYPELDLTFSDSEAAFKYKTNLEVLRACLVFHLLTVNFFADNQMMLMKLGRKVMGQALFEKIMKATVFGHFVAGVDQEDIAPKIKRMREFGVYAILDYSAEEDVVDDPPPPKKPWELNVVGDSVVRKKELKFKGDISGSERKKAANVRTYFYKNEAACDKNMEIFLNAIKAVAGTTEEGTGFAAIKLTALAKPSLLLKLSEAIERVHVFMEYFTGVCDAVNNQSMKLEDLKKRFEEVAKGDAAVQAWLDSIDADSCGVIHLLPWKSLLAAQKSVVTAMRIPNVQHGKLENLVAPFTTDETKAFDNAIKRCHTVFTAARNANVRVMVDAEQTYLQPAISRVTLEMMKVYNTKSPIIFNTYQCYLKEAYHNVVTDLKQAERQNFFFGAKLVRGAYMEQERLRAKTMDYEDPINPTYEATTEMYIKCMGEFLAKIKQNKEAGQPKKVIVMAASHNEDTMRFVIKKMKEDQIGRGHHVVFFGQLYGMCDQISFPLGQSGYQVYKYVPYGPVAEVMPYLSRRAQENRGLLGKTAKERRLLRQEILRRIKATVLFKSKDKLDRTLS